MTYVLPGMGADSSIFRGEWRTLENCVFLDWPVYRGEHTLRAIAERIVREAGITHGSVVIGHSLGGMVACEIAKLRDLKALGLISSALQKEEVSRLFTVLHPLAAITPFRFAQAFVRSLPGDLYEMFARSDPDFIRATCKAIFRWEGLKGRPVPVSRIHGRHDWVITLPDDVEQVVEGGHILPITHPRECVEFIRTILR